MRLTRSALALPLLLLAPGTVSAVDSPIPQGLPANVITVSFPKETRSYPALNAAGDVVGTTTWRVVRNTGNCCENHLAATSTGRLIDFGGTYLNFSDNQGLTWKQVRPIEPFLGGEGTVTIAPNGDIVSIAWDVYSGDRVLAFKMDAATGAWTYQQNPLHTPVFDREWVAMIPRPGLGAGPQLKAPYAAVLRGGWPSKDVWYYSLDGLTYAAASNKNAGGNVTPVSRWLPTTADPAADWTQPISESSIAPLNGGGALAAPADLLDGFFGNGWMILERGTLRWTQFRLGDGSALPSGRLVMDSLGRIHLLNAGGNEVEYRMSDDGGRTWSTANATLPGATVENWDFRANGAQGRTIVGVHAHKSTGTDQDYLMEFSTACGAPEHLLTRLVGDGNLNASSGLGAAIRFDFATVALLPDGTPATSFIDQAHQQPALAIALSTQPSDPGVGLPQPSC